LGVDFDGLYAVEQEAGGVCVGCGEEIRTGLLCGWCVELEDAA
jgi:hypothetical protein